MVIDGPAAPNPVNSSKGAERKQKIVSKKNVLMQSQSYTKQAKLILWWCYDTKCESALSQSHLLNE